MQQEWDFVVHLPDQVSMVYDNSDYIIWLPYSLISKNGTHLSFGREVSDN